MAYKNGTQAVEISNAKWACIDRVVGAAISNTATSVCWSSTLVYASSKHSSSSNNIPKINFPNTRSSSDTTVF